MESKKKLEKETLNELSKFLFSEYQTIPIYEHKKKCRIDEGCQEDCDLAGFYNEKK